MSATKTLAELAEASGIPARTIRFYIARGLLDGPVKAGRAAAYTAAHLDRLEEIKKLQSKGRSLAEIAQAAADGDSPAPEREPEPWWSYVLSDDVTVWVRAAASPWRMKHIREGIGKFQAHLKIDERRDRK